MKSGGELWQRELPHGLYVVQWKKKVSLSTSLHCYFDLINAQDVSDV